MCKFGSDSDSEKPTTSIHNDVIELTDANFDKLVLQSNDAWLVVFSAPWCGHCKTLAPHWARAATELRGKVKFGILDGTAHPLKAEEYGIRGYPTIKVFLEGPKSSADAKNYNGGRRTSKIVAWALEKFPDKVPAPELIEIVDQTTFDLACENKSLCVVSILPHILNCNAKCRNTYLDILKEMGEKYKANLWGWAWTESAAQSKLEETFEIDGFGYPVIAVVNFQRMKYSVLKDAFVKEDIDKFLTDISNGRGKTTPIRNAEKPKIKKIKRWNGRDSELPEVGEALI